MQKTTTMILIVMLVSYMFFGCANCPAREKAGKRSSPKKIPVIFDTDIGDDIDDTWALAFLLKSPELDVKLVVGDNGKATYRAKLLAKFLVTADRTDIPVGIGVKLKGGGGRQSAWVKNYDLNSYPGEVHKDGVQAIIDTIMNSKEQIVVIAVGPVQNIKAALEREPKIAKRARFIGMHGSVRLGYGGSKKIAPEYNVRVNANSCQKVFTAPWDIMITPLDTCGLIQLTGKDYQLVFQSKDPGASAVIENYRIWAEKINRSKAFPIRSSTLFDTVAVYLAFSQKLTKIEQLRIRVTDKGFTVIDSKAKKMKVATKWKNMEKFEKLLSKRVAAAATR